MVYTIESAKLNSMQDYSEGFKPQKFKRYIAVFNINQQPEKLIDEMIADDLYVSSLENKTSRFESYDDFDIICMKVNHFKSEPDEKTSYVFIFMQNNLMQFVCEDTAFVDDFIEHVIATDINVTYGKILYLFFTFLIENDLIELEKIEDKLAEYENEILNFSTSKINYSQLLIAVSRHLRATKQYYEQFLNIVENLSWNENNLLETKALKYFKILNGKLSRLYSTAVNLIAFATEVREAYQMEVDLRANKIMQLLTVVTVIFLPLTLIVGWYGMNLKMPEFSIMFFYPIVIMLSLSVCVSIIVYFKKRHWF
jgi:magnesium transporter